MSSLIDNLKAARGAGVPLLAVSTHDQPATIEAVCKGVNGATTPQIQWDCINGLRPINQAGRQALAELGERAKDAVRAVLALRMLVDVAPRSLVFFCNAHVLYGDPGNLQAIHNLRELFKTNKRTLLLLGPSHDAMPPGLQADVVTLDEALPTDKQLADLITQLHADAGKTVTPEQLPSMVSAVRGLPALFTVEQVVAMSFRKAGLCMAALWERTAAAINATKGLEFSRPTLKFSDLAGMDTIMRFVRRIAKGRRPFRVVLMWDEIEKMMAGSGGEATDSSGVSSDFLNVCLKKMEELGWAGMILLGVPGSGKTAFAQATCGENDVPMVQMDFGAMKGRYVGDSEGAVRQAFSVVESLGGSDVLVIATCNKLRSLPPEFKRRFWLGNWYYDVPTQAEQKPIKKLYSEKYETQGSWPNTANWTGAEIRNAARLSDRLQCSLEEASRFVVPVAKADPEAVAALRELADGKFLSVSYDGTWEKDRMDAPKGKKTRRQIGGDA